MREQAWWSVVSVGRAVSESVCVRDIEGKWACGDELHGECKVKVEEVVEEGEEEAEVEEEDWGAVSVLIFV